MLQSTSVTVKGWAITNVWNKIIIPSMYCIAWHGTYGYVVNLIIDYNEEEGMYTNCNIHSKISYWFNLNKMFSLKMYY